MRTTYSIVSAVIRPEIAEHLTIGLLLIGTDKVYFQFSKDKLNVTKELLPNSTFRFLKESVINLEKQVEKHNSHSETLFDFEMKNSLFEESYIEYLNVYNNNLLQFSKPRLIDMTGDNNLFKSLFAKYIDSTIIVADQERKKEVDYVKRSFTPSLKNYYNIDQQVSQNEFVNLPMPVTVDMIGKNEVYVYAQWIDLQRPKYHILNDIGTILILNKALSNRDKKFVLSTEPDKKSFPQQFDIWQNLRKNDLAEYVDISEAKKILEYASIHQVKPLFTDATDD